MRFALDLDIYYLSLFILNSLKIKIMKYYSKKIENEVYQFCNDCNTSLISALNTLMESALDKKQYNRYSELNAMYCEEILS